MTNPLSSLRPIIVLDNVRSAHNVGSIFRTADAAGVQHIYLLGYTPQPIDRFGRAVPEIAKTALGAEQSMPWSHCADADVLMDNLTDRKVPLAAIEQTPTATSLFDYTPPMAAAFVFGNEVDGVSPEVLDRAAAHVMIPMFGQKESLNVGVSVGVTLFTLQHAHCRAGK